MTPRAARRAQRDPAPRRVRVLPSAGAPDPASAGDVLRELMRALETTTDKRVPERRVPPRGVGE